MSIALALALICIAMLLGALLIRTQIILLLLRNRDVDHAKCIAHLAHYVGNEFAAKVLDAAAEDYNSPEGQHEVRVIVHTQYAQGGLSVPSLWMKNRATDLREEVQG